MSRSLIVMPDDSKLVAVHVRIISFWILAVTVWM